MEKESGGSIQSIRRCFALLEALAQCGGAGAELKALAQSTGLPKSTAHRILSNLMELGYVGQVPDTGNYRATLRLFEIGSGLVGKMDVVTIARPYLDELSARLGETVHMVVRDGTEVVYVHKAEAGTLAMGSRIGARIPMYCTAVGKAILASLPHAQVRQIWEQSDRTPRTPATVQSFEALEKQLSAVRRRGWALDDEENEPGIRCVAVALPSAAGVGAAFSISSTAARITDDRALYLAEQCMEVAARIRL